MTTGIKSVLLKPVDPLFKHEGRGNCCANRGQGQTGRSFVPAGYRPRDERSASDQVASVGATSKRIVEPFSLGFSRILDFRSDKAAVTGPQNDTLPIVNYNRHPAPRGPVPVLSVTYSGERVSGLTLPNNMFMLKFGLWPRCRNQSASPGSCAVAVVNPGQPDRVDGHGMLSTPARISPASTTE